MQDLILKLIELLLFAFKLTLEILLELHFISDLFLLKQMNFLLQFCSCELSVIDFIFCDSSLLFLFADLIVKRFGFVKNSFHGGH